MPIPPAPPATPPSSVTPPKLPGLELLLNAVAPLQNRLEANTGRSFLAQVLAQIPVTQGEKQQLLALLNLDTKTASPALTPALRQLISSPALTLISLKIPGSAAPISTLSAAPLPNNIAVRLVVRPDGQLQLVTQDAAPTPAKTSNMPAPTRAPAPASPANINTPSGSSPTTATRPAPKDVSGPSLQAMSAPNLKPLLQAELSEVLRSALPKAQPLAPLLQLLHTISAQLPPEKQHLLPQLITPAVVKIMQALQTQTQAIAKVVDQPALTQPLKEAIKNSGVFLEAQLKNAPPPSNPVNAKLDTPTPVLEQDIKALLLGAIAQLNSSTPTATPSAVPEDASVDALFMHLFGGRKTDVMGQPSPQLPTASAKFLLQEALLPLLQKSLALIQVQQSQTASALLDEPNRQHFQLDIPLRLPDGFGNLALKIQELPYYATDEKSEQKKRDAKTQMRQWRVFMEFDLGNAGLLTAQIHWLPQQLRAQFWADNKTLRKKTQERLKTLQQQLREAGLPIDSLICNQNTPPKSTINIHYALVDVST